MKRRSFLSLAPSSGVALAFPAVTQAAQPDPMVKLYHEWLDARREWRELAELPGNGSYDHPESVAAEAREKEAAEAMMLLMPTSLEGMSALAALVWECVEPGVLDPVEYDRLAQLPECRVVKAIWKACTGKEGYPET